MMSFGNKSLTDRYFRFYRNLKEVLASRVWFTSWEKNRTLMTLSGSIESGRAPITTSGRKVLCPIRPTLRLRRNLCDQSIHIKHSKRSDISTSIVCPLSFSPSDLRTIVAVSVWIEWIYWMEVQFVRVCLSRYPQIYDRVSFLLEDCPSWLADQ